MSVIYDRERGRGGGGGGGGGALTDNQRDGLAHKNNRKRKKIKDRRKVLKNVLFAREKSGG